jgi:hypothetical protein
MNKYFHISIIWTTPAKPLDQLRPIFDLALEWIFYGGNNWIIYTGESTYTWQGRMRAVTNDSDFFFICEIANIENSGGWLPKWVWDWIKKERFVPALPFPCLESSSDPESNSDSYGGL